MKNKYVTYGLLLLVLAIWGALGYRLLPQNKDEDEFIANTALVYNMIQAEDSIENYQLKERYRDPFLGKTTSTSEKPKSRPKSINKVQEYRIEDKGIVIKYSGQIVNHKTGKIVGLLNINGEKLIFSPGEERNGMQVVEIRKEYIEIVHLKNKVKILVDEK